MSEPTVGRIVTYRTLAGLDCAAIIISVPGSGHTTPPADGHVHLHVFYPRDTAGDFITDEGVPQEVVLGEDHKPGTWRWRWPERV